jgi:polyphosphate kinase
VTSRIYEDIGIFTCDDAIGSDVTDLFNYLTGYSTNQHFKKLLVAPVNLRSGLEKLILREIDHAKAGNHAHLIIKVNSVVDPGFIELLYKASRAGVKVDLLVRGMCCLRPGVKGVSDNIRVISIVGRYLEHSRVFYFLNNGKEEVYMGSADLMTRNQDHRVEVVFPVEDMEHIHYVRHGMLAMYLSDNTRARMMKPDGSYVRLKPPSENKSVDVQEYFARSNTRSRKS